MTDSFYDQYSKKSKTAKELWDTLKLVYQAEEARSKKFLVLNYMDFKMTDDRPVSVQVHEFQLIANDICAAGMVLDENFHVGAIVAKLPPTWKEYRHKPKHKKEDLALDQLMQHLHIQEETRNREKEHAKETIVKAHVVVDKDEKKNLEGTDGNDKKKGRKENNNDLVAVVTESFMVGNKTECKFRAGSGVLICLYVDDMLIFGTDIDRINEAKNFLASNFSMKDLGDADVILGIKIIRSQHGIVSTQSSYIEKILRRFNHYDDDPAPTPIDPSVKLTRSRSAGLLDPALIVRPRQRRATVTLRKRIDSIG
ncbi:hypothetical protein RJ639_042149 [Escallonia herrerae]|uniref:Reverse transcriptase Ty1/copia-type domain-containing protein n=1 Tax=Escallonia herrerae TaxID=1293975 RepID=A0AA88WE93_9ASTE|nr:hypothetical protein RJ639_042149 [Escallonia herrerae]